MVRLCIWSQFRPHRETEGERCAEPLDRSHLLPAQSDGSALQRGPLVEVEGRILVRRALSDDVSLTPKNAQEREVPLAALLERRLRDVVADKPQRARMVLNDSGATPRRQRVLTELKRFLAKKGMKPRSFHSHRHYFVLALVNGGAGAEAARVLAGHSKLEVTQRYAHVVTADLRAAIDRLGQ